MTLSTKLYSLLYTVYKYRLKPPKPCLYLAWPIHHAIVNLYIHLLKLIMNFQNLLNGLKFCNPFIEHACNEKLIIKQEPWEDISGLVTHVLD